MNILDLFASELPEDWTRWELTEIEYLAGG